MPTRYLKKSQWTPYDDNLRERESKRDTAELTLEPPFCEFNCHRETLYLCSKSTVAVTSCTRKYLASAGYFRATASYIA